ncbi:MNNG and nitrosoguanidine resistance protein [Rutstroemia sp. NJR-2017a BBW]|nr:MNNG and nitrosoguanidine resistance protein [Rutstroemia sp. NJR-2017a BBW]
MLVVFFVLLVATIMGTMSIHWGGDHSLQFNLRVLTVAVVDFDQGEIGNYLKEMVVEERSKDYKRSLGFVNVDGAEMDESVDEVYRKLHRQDFWFAIIVNSNASETMNAAFAGDTQVYDPKGAVEVVYEEARNALVIGKVLYPKVIAFLDQFVLDFTKQKQKALMDANSNGDSNFTNIVALQRQLKNPVATGFTISNMAPAIPSTAAAATEIGTIYLIIVSFLSVLMFDKLSDTIMGNIPTKPYYIYRIIILPFVYFFLSLFYLCLSCVWNISFSKFYGGSGYVLYWMLSWVSMMAFGLCIENINNILGMPFTPVFFVFWVISNVTTGFYPTEMLSNFYKWGIVWPLRHDVMGARAIIYGTKNTLRENFGALLGWVIISLLLLPGTVWLQLRKKKDLLEKKRGEVLERVWGEPAREKGGVLRMPTLR